jgi:metal-responsive CopG/Arc/MetJ family transcriptional regulator
MKTEEERKGKEKIKEVVGMSGKNMVEMRIPREELENIDELVREGYYGNRSDAIEDILRRGAAYIRLQFHY